MRIQSLKERAKSWIDRALLPSAAKAALLQDEKGLPLIDPGPRQVVEAVIAWLCRAQDNSATRDGGVARHFSLIDGWSASYPETTGYIVPTMIDHARETGDNRLLDRSRRMLDWLVSIQYPEGSFQGGMIGQTPRVPVAFNTGQILIGLASGAELDTRYREPMRRAADWLVASQDTDGCWRQHPSPFANAGAKTYDTHLALGLIRAAAVEPERGYTESAFKQVDWALGNQSANGWLAHCCLSDPARPLTHTLGYALRGIVEAAGAAKDGRYLEAACKTADGLMLALEPDGRIPGRLDAQWQPAAGWVCLTGSSQIAESWLLLHRATGREAYRRAALLANSFVRRTVLLEGAQETRGGVKGAFPIGGAYGRWQYLNWAGKFTIDANRLELQSG